MRGVLRQLEAKLSEVETTIDLLIARKRNALIQQRVFDALNKTGGVKEKERSAKVLPVGMPFRRFQANDTRLAFSGKRSDYNRWGAFGMRPALSQAAPRCPGLVDKRKCNAQQKASGFRWC